MLTANPDKSVHFKVFGSGTPLILGYPIRLHGAAGDMGAAALPGYLERLTDCYQVLVMDYPYQDSVAKSARPRMTADQVCKDLIAVADAAGFARFVWWGFSWGGLVGLQLASRSDRVSGLVCGAWPPLEGPCADTLRAIRVLASDPPPGLTVSPEQFVPFYESVQNWDEAAALETIRCPRLVFVGSDDEFELAGVKLRFAATIRQHRPFLEKNGWCVTEIPGRDHSVYADPAAVVPVVREFLDRAIQR